ncbi:MAG TPA: squalene/phytoene synthase family protein [Anaerolineales bacterium]|nr:squalene/phytoene synthase family protein [Anaerolineales bacterium]
MGTNEEIQALGAAITRAASLQTYATVRYLVDSERVGEAYQAYAYFRWVDDWLDEPRRQRADRLAFVQRQSALIDQCYEGGNARTEALEEEMLVSLVRTDPEQSSGLYSYIRNMLAVMAFDAERRGRLISQAELDSYQRALATAVTEALHYFIGHGAAAPRDATRYLAAEGAHIVHMLRDTVEDCELGYFNVPREFLNANGITPDDIDCESYRWWVKGRVELARSYFLAGRLYLSQAKSLRCRLAGYAYIARFEGVLDSIERDGYLLRPEYRDAKGARAGAQMGWSILWAALMDRRAAPQSSVLTTR